MKIKKIARKLQEEIGADPALAKPSYCWCREQVVARLGVHADTQLISAAFLRQEQHWTAFVAEVKSRARRAG